MSNRNERVTVLLKKWSYEPIPEQASGKPANGVLRRIRRAWMALARAIGKANALVLLSLVYGLVIGPAALFLKIVGKDLLERRIGNEGTFWKRKIGETQGVERSKRQF